MIEHIDFVVADLRDEDECRMALAKCDVVVHLASKVGGIRYYLSKPYEVLRDNILMDSNVLNAVISGQVPLLFLRQQCARLSD